MNSCPIKISTPLVASRLLLLLSTAAVTTSPVHSFSHSLPHIILLLLLLFALATRFSIANYYSVGLQLSIIISVIIIRPLGI